MGYNAQSGYINTGPVTIGRNVVVGELSVLDIGSRLEDGSQLAHCSAVLSGMTLGAGRRYHGSPAEECGASYELVEPRRVSLLAKTIYTAAPPLLTLFVLAPIVPMVLYVAFPSIFGNDLRTLAVMVPPLSPKIALAFAAGLALALISGLISSLAVMAIIPRMLNVFIEEDRIYPLYGVRYYIFRLISGMSNSLYFNILLGDSSYIVRFLQLIGWNLSKVVQTGSNFGTEQMHDIPFLCTVGSGTIASSGLYLLNAQFSNSSFRACRVAIGENNFLGTLIYIPPGSKAGNNCLLATKVMVPVDGPVRENIGLLGSPSIAIPRSGGPDPRALEELHPDFRRKALPRKNRF